MFFGSQKKMKSVIAAEVATLIAWQVIDSTDRVGAIVFNDAEAVTLMPQRSHLQVIKIIAEITKQNQALKTGVASTSHQVSLENMFTQALRISGHDALVILIGDGYGWNDRCGEYVKKLTQHNDFICCHVTDPLEHKLAELPQMVVSDGNVQVEVSGQEQKLQQEFEQNVKTSIGSFTELANQYRIPLLPFNTVDEADKQLCRALGVDL